MAFDPATMPDPNQIDENQRRGLLAVIASGDTVEIENNFSDVCQELAALGCGLKETAACLALAECANWLTSSGSTYELTQLGWDLYALWKPVERRLIRPDIRILQAELGAPNTRELILYNQRRFPITRGGLVMLCRRFVRQNCDTLARYDGATCDDMTVQALGGPYVLAKIRLSD